jgi:hypothetical protein
MMLSVFVLRWTGVCLLSRRACSYLNCVFGTSDTTAPHVPQTRAVRGMREPQAGQITLTFSLA